jgi:hypothetical protein
MDEGEQMTICHNSFGRWHQCTNNVSQELTNATYLGSAVVIHTTKFTSEVDLLKDGSKFMLVTVVRITSPNGSTFNVNVEIATFAMVEEASFAIPTAGITNVIPWCLENKGVVWMNRVLYFSLFRG